MQKAEVAVHIHQHMLEVITEVEAMYSLITVQAEMDITITIGLFREMLIRTPENQEQKGVGK